MPTWVVVLINAILLAYCVFMVVFGRIKKNNRIQEAKRRLKEEFKDEIENQDDKKQ